MQVAKPVGREAASRKYDILSAIMAFALSQDKTVQRQCLRLMSLITTRYNWQRDELSMSQEDIATLWSVDTRTVKREMARLRTKGWLVLKRQGARGRVSLYGLDLALILQDTRPAWDHIGPDFIARVAPQPGPAQSNVVPLHRPAAQMATPVQDGSVWAQAQVLLQQADPASYQAWFHSLVQADLSAGQITLQAPSKFHATYVEGHMKPRLLSALRSVDPSVGALRILA